MIATEPSWLALFWVGVIVVAILVYVILDGFDLGIGILFATTDDETLRGEMMATIAPFWDGNETWLVVIGTSLFAAFPVAYAVFLPAFYIPVLLLLFGLIFRGVAFEFRHRDARRLWDRGFYLGSAAVAFVQGGGATSSIVDDCVGVAMRRLRTSAHARTVSVGLSVLVGGTLTAPNDAFADEGGVSFWLPGLYASLAAASVQPGWSVTAMEYLDSVRAGGDVALAREVQIGRFTPRLNVDINASLHSRIDIGLLLPSYTFEQRFLGAQATVAMMTLVGNVDTTLQGTIAGTLGPFGFSKFGSRTDDVTAAGDLYPIFNLRWNEGVNNFMTYVTGDLPVGLYDRTSLSNVGIGHHALDGGVGYTYFNPATGHESPASPTTSSIRIPTIRMASIPIWTGARRNSSPSSC
jgi:hypothetical protein